MSFDIVDIIKEMDVHSIPLQLALQCAPVISGIKISNLLTIPAKSLRELSVVLKKTELSFRIFISRQGKACNTYLQRGKA